MEHKFQNNHRFIFHEQAVNSLLQTPQEGDIPNWNAVAWHCTPVQETRPNSLLHPQMKGKMERSVGVIKSSFWPGSQLWILLEN